jgi:TonB family protein
MPIAQLAILALALTAALAAQSIQVVDRGGPAVLYASDPDYPAAALKAGIEGDVVVRIHIARDGRVDRATPASGNPLLIPPAVNAVKQFQFAPREASTNWSFRFSLKHPYHESLPIVTRHIEPAYPAAAQQKGIRGTVRLVALFNPAGRVQQIETITGNPLLLPAAREAVQHWEFLRTLPDGRRTGGTAVIEIAFPPK